MTGDSAIFSLSAASIREISGYTCQTHNSPNSFGIMHMTEEGVVGQKNFSLSSPNEERAGVRSFDFIAVFTNPSS